MPPGCAGAREWPKQRTETGEEGREEAAKSSGASAADD